MNVEIRRFREAISLALIVLFVGFAVYSLLGLAWTFKTAVESTQKIRRSI